MHQSVLNVAGEPAAHCLPGLGWEESGARLIVLVAAPLTLRPQGERS